MKLAVIDIETVPAAHTEDAQIAKSASLSPATGRIVCIGVLLVENFEPKHAEAFVGEDERSLLSEFWNFLAKNDVRRFIAHNGLGFDFPFLWCRSVVHQVRPTIQMDLRKFQTHFVFDTMAIWSNWNPRNYVKLGTISQLLSVGEKAGSGEDVLDLWTSGKYADIAQYCLKDCWLTFGCYCRMNFKPVPVFDTLRIGAAQRGPISPPDEREASCSVM